MQRAVAYVGDGFLALWAWLIPLAILSQGSEPRYLVPTFLISHAIYYIGFMVFVGATPGKLALRMRIVMIDGSRPERDVLILRYLVFLVGFLSGVGTLVNAALIITDPERRSVHDRIAKTRVILVSPGYK